MNNEEVFKNDLEEGLLSTESYQNLLNDNKGMLINLDKKKVEKLEEKKVSVIIPTHNRVNQLIQCVNSILNQTYNNLEIIIIDDVSTDDTKKVFSNHKDNRVKYFKNEKNLGMGLNRQKGYNLSDGDYIIFIDDDDYYTDFNYFKEAIDVFEKNSDVNIICSHTYIHYEEENIYKLHRLNMPNTLDSISYLEKFQNIYLKPTSLFPAMLRRRTMDEALFSEMKMMNDSSVYLRLLMMGGKTWINNKIIGIYRIHGQNDTFNVKADFTIENLKEKKYIFEYIKRNNLIKYKNRWFTNQVFITVFHFLNGKESKKSEIDKVLSWVKKNASFKCYFKLKLCLLKKILKGKSYEND